MVDASTTPRLAELTHGAPEAVDSRAAAERLADERR